MFLKKIHSAVLFFILIIFSGNGQISVYSAPGGMGDTDQFHEESGRESGPGGVAGSDTEENETTDVTDTIKFVYPESGRDVHLDGGGEFGDINPTNITNFEQVGERFVTLMTGTVVLITILVFSIGGGFWIFSAGNESLVERGKDMMKYSVIGILLVLGAYVIVRLFQVILYAVGT